MEPPEEMIRSFIGNKMGLLKGPLQFMWMISFLGVLRPSKVM